MPDGPSCKALESAKGQPSVLVAVIRFFPGGLVDIFRYAYQGVRRVATPRKAAAAPSPPEQTGARTAVPDEAGQRPPAAGVGRGAE